jgi:hypothetical protein
MANAVTTVYIVEVAWIYSDYRNFLKYMIGDHWFIGLNRIGDQVTLARLRASAASIIGYVSH